MPSAFSAPYDPLAVLTVTLHAYSDSTSHDSEIPCRKSGLRYRTNEDTSANLELRLSKLM